VKIYHDINTFKARKSVVTIGTFDGVHRGHQRVIQRLREIAVKEGGESVILTFYPHPRLVTSSNEANLRLLTTLEEKELLFERSGVDHLIVFPFTKSFSELQYSEFVEKILIGKLKIHYLVIGYDHRFGKNREGGYEYLQDCAERLHFKIEKLPPLQVDNIHISSTQIRKALQEGLISKANNYLGYRYTLHGKVTEGRGLGREIGFPTANIEASDINKLIPGNGVYAVEIIIAGKKYKGMLNIGSRPTFNRNADKRSIEVHIFNFEGNLYDKKIILVFADKIRNEKKFSGAAALAEQLKKDKVTALKILSG
jgi:riboflavin kinase / FMN adenylyltransferase